MRENTHQAVLSTIAKVSALPALMALPTADIVAIQNLLRTEVHAGAFSILHLANSYNTSYQRLEEINHHLLHGRSDSSAVLPLPVPSGQAMLAPIPNQDAPMETPGAGPSTE